MQMYFITDRVRDEIFSVLLNYDPQIAEETKTTFPPIQGTSRDRGVCVDI